MLSKSVAEVCLELAEKWIERDGEGTSSDDLKSFRATQTMYFLDQLLTRGTVDLSRVQWILTYL